MPKIGHDRCPEKFAENILTRLAIKTFPIPVDKIAEELGAQVHFAPFDDELSGMVYIKDQQPIIGVNALHHPNRQRFTIAHELGHLELHRNTITTAVHVDKAFPALMRHSNPPKGTEEVEMEANQFAAALLMPRTMILQVLSGDQFDIDDESPLKDLARKFKVSKQALEYRIRNLR